MEIVKYNKRAGKLTPVIRQIVSKQGRVFHIATTNAGIMVRFQPIFMETEWRYLRDISYKALADWLFSKSH